MKKFFENDPMIFSTGSGTPGSPHDTIENFGNAIERGSDVIRTNVSMTRDGAIVCYSDEVFTVDAIRKSGIPSFDLERLRGMLLQSMSGPAGGGGEMFPVLEDALRAFPGQKFNLFFHDTSAELMDGVVGIIAGMNAGGRILASARSGFCTEKMAAGAPDAAIASSTAAMIGTYALFRAGLLYFKKGFGADALIIPVRIGASYIANDALIHEVRSKGIRVYIMYVDSPGQARAFREAGADGFITNDIATIKQALA